MSATTTPVSTAAVLGSPSEFLIPRESDRDLAFQGWRLSQVKDCQKPQSPGDVSRCTQVSIYLTAGKAIVWSMPAFTTGG